MWIEPKDVKKQAVGHCGAQNPSLLGGEALPLEISQLCKLIVSFWLKSVYLEFFLVHCNGKIFQIIKQSDELSSSLFLLNMIRILIEFKIAAFFEAALLIPNSSLFI